MTSFEYQDVLAVGEDDTDYELVSKDFVETAEFKGQKMLCVAPEGLSLLAQRALSDVSFFLRANHLASLQRILEDSEASDNDRFVAETMLKNSIIASAGVLPTCQDTGTAIVFAKKGQQVWSGGEDHQALSQGIFQAYQERNLRYSQMAPLSMFEEKNTSTNLPAQIDIMAASGQEYRFLFVAKGGGSANKSFLYQQTKSLLNEANLSAFIKEKIKSIGTSACPPYHLAVVIGGTSAEMNLKTLKLASCKYYDNLPQTGNHLGRGFRDLEWEAKVLDMCQELGIGAQFGGKYFAHDVRVVRLPRHAASCPVSIGVSCSADRNIKAKITAEGIFVERLEKAPEKYLPQVTEVSTPSVEVDLNRPMAEIRAQLSQYPIKTRLKLKGTLIVARDVAHAKLSEMLDAGQPLPDYFKNHPVYYAGPAKTPEGMPSGSFGPTTAGRMDPYVARFMAAGGSMVMLAKGNRSKAVREACASYGGFYLGSIGGPAAILAKENIKAVEIVDFPELGMEAIRKIEVVDFPAFIICDDKGNDFFAALS